MGTFFALWMAQSFIYLADIVFQPGRRIAVSRPSLERPRSQWNVSHAGFAHKLRQIPAGSRFASISCGKQIRMDGDFRPDWPEQVRIPALCANHDSCAVFRVGSGTGGSCDVGTGPDESGVAEGRTDGSMIVSERLIDSSATTRTREFLNSRMAGSSSRSSSDCSRCWRVAERISTRFRGRFDSTTRIKMQRDRESVG